MTLAIIAFFSVFLLIASVGLILFYREGMLERLTAVIAPQEANEEKKTMSTRLEQTSSSIGNVVEKFERILPKSQAEVSIVQQRLIRAGYRSEAAIDFFYGTKVLVPILLCVVVTLTPLATSNPVVFYIAALGLGYLAPDFWLGNRIKARQKRIRLGLPDVLDLLVICVEAGLGLDQATVRTTQELKPSHPVIADELEILVLEQRAGRSRSDSWRHLSERTDLDIVRNLVSMLVQSEQFGTSVAKTLRTHSDTLRTQRIQTVEEAAAKTTVKLIFPLVFFIFPCLFLVTLGPAVIMMSDAFQNILSH